MEKERADKRYSEEKEKVLGKDIQKFFVYKRIEEPPVEGVEEVFLIHSNGCLIAHDTLRLKPYIDDDLLSGMLTAIQNFVRDAFRAERKWELHELDFGENKIVIERGKYIYLAVVLSIKEYKGLLPRMKRVISEVERKHKKNLEKWDGNLEPLRGTRDIIKKIFS